MDVSFLLYEALLWEPSRGYFLLDLHLERLHRSATHFGFALDLEDTRSALDKLGDTLASEPRKVRLELARDGSLKLQSLAVRPSTPVRVHLAREPVSSADEFLRHKTSRRDVYDRALAAQPDAQDVILWNQRGELTETCHANLVLAMGEARVTPALDCGLLPGTFRAHLLEQGRIEERVLPVAALREADGLFLINSVRRWCALQLISD